MYCLLLKKKKDKKEFSEEDRRKALGLDFLARRDSIEIKKLVQSSNFFKKNCFF